MKGPSWTLSDLLFRIRALFRRETVERELDEELRLHIEHAVEKQVRMGLPRAEAIRQARLSLGGVEQVKELCREARGVSLVETTLRDVRYSLRTMRRSPGFAAAAILSLALGIGANTAVFTLIDAVTLRPLPVGAPAELVAVGDPSRPTALWEGAPMVDVLSYPLYQRLRERNHVFSGLLASGRAGRVEMAVEGSGAEEIRGRLVSGNYFDVLGLSASMGRVFSADREDNAGASPVAVISHDFWERRFNSDPGVLGRPIRLNSSPFTIVGVGPRAFVGEVVGSPADVWIPISLQPWLQGGMSRLGNRGSNWLLALGRLAPGTSLERARAELTVLTQQTLMEFAGPNLSSNQVDEIRARPIPVQSGARGFSWVRKNVAPLLFTLMAVVGLVLVIACANIANLLLARAMARRKEISVRLALGASRGRLIRQLLTEGAVLAFVGGAAGFAAAGWGSRLLSRLASRGGSNPVPFDVDVQPDLAVLAFTASVALLTTVFFALVPALRSTRFELSPALRESARIADPRGWSVGRLLVVGQLALSVPLLATAGLFVGSLAYLEALDVGYSRENLVVVKAELVVRPDATPGERLMAARSSIERLGSIPSVTGVTLSENGLFSGLDSGTQSLQVRGFQPSTRADTSSSFDQVGPHYFAVIGIPLVAGREFDGTDRVGAPPVAILNETMANFYFGKRSPIGESIQNGNDRYRIVGVVKDSKQRDLKGRIERRFYVPLLQTTDRIQTVHFAIKTSSDAQSLIPAIRRSLLGMGGSLRTVSVDTARDLMSQTLSSERSLARFSGLFALVALALAVAGLYGLTSYAIARRTNEIGIRMALGASRVAVIGMVIRGTLALMAIGFAVGVPTALAATRLIGANVAGVKATDPANLLRVVSLMFAVGVAAVCIPAVRASRVDPVSALRID